MPATTRSPAQHVRELGLPRSALIALIERGKQTIPPRGSTVVQAGDRLYVLVPHGDRAALDDVFEPLAAACLDGAMPVLCCPDKFRGSLTAAEAAAAMCAGVERAGYDARRAAARRRRRGYARRDPRLARRARCTRRA